MITVKDIESLPDNIKTEVLDYAEYLLTKYGPYGQKINRTHWANVASRGRSINESASETVRRLREEERW